MTDLLGNVEKQVETDRNTLERLWRAFQATTTQNTLTRIKSRVLSGWTLEKAIRNEGIMLCRTTLNSKLAREMFQNGDLKAEVKPFSSAQVTKQQKRLEEEASEGKTPEEPVVAKTPENFIRRPKAN